MNNKIVLTVALILLSFSSASFAENLIEEKAAGLLRNMSLREKIGQKIMLDVRYWCGFQSKMGESCKEDFTSLNENVKQIFVDNHIGGIILFANNLKNVDQITTLTHELQQTMQISRQPGLLIATDQEGGLVGRLPRQISASFSGNMSIAAANLGNPDRNYSAETGKIIGADLKAVGINTDFAPDVDVNVNPLNPVIHVRSFSDDPELVAKLGLEFSKGIKEQNIAVTLKHFPGHGDTVTDSHLGLPIVNHTLQQAFAIDLYPFKKIIEIDSPDLIMTAHIQYPALDNTQIYAGKSGKNIIIPATLSRKIQTDLLRGQLKYQGVIITDALDMGAIAEHFDNTDAVIKTFQAGVDIALMPLAVSSVYNSEKVNELVSIIEIAVLNGSISEREIDESVLRILKLKIKLGLMNADVIPLSEKIIKAKAILADAGHHSMEAYLADDAMTLVQNKNKLIPLKLTSGMRIHILTPWLEQGAGIATEMHRLQTLGYLPPMLEISFIKMANTDFDTEKMAVDNADIIIVGNSATTLSSLENYYSIKLATMINQPKETLVFPELLLGDSEKSARNKPVNKLFLKNNLPDDLFAYRILQYAASQYKKTIFISLLAPYDLPNYANVADAMLAGYDHYGYLPTDPYHGYYRGPSMQALTRIIFGVSRAQGKLPVNIPDSTGKIMYSRGFGLNTK